MNKQEESSLKVEVVTEWYANQRDRDYVLVFNSEIDILNGNYIRVDTTTERTRRIIVLTTNYIKKLINKV